MFHATWCSYNQTNNIEKKCLHVQICIHSYKSRRESLNKSLNKKISTSDIDFKIIKIYNETVNLNWNCKA